MITIDGNGGVGIHTVYTVTRDGKPIAMIDRWSPRHGWEIPRS
jgi:hypothetical protein